MVRKVSILFVVISMLLISPGDDIRAQASAKSPLRDKPRLIRVSADRLARAELLGTPEVKLFLGYTRRVLHLHDGHTLAFFSYSSAAQANWLFLLDGRDLSSKRYDIPNNDVASHGGALGADGNVYIMPYSTGRAYRFDVKARKFEPLDTGLPPGQLTWDALGSSNGRIYFGTYPDAYLGEYDPSTGKCALWKQIAPHTKYVTDFSEDSEGHIHFKAWGPDEVWMVFDPKTQGSERAPKPAPSPTAESASALPEIPEGDTGFETQLKVGERTFVVSTPTSRLWEIRSDGKLLFRGDPGSPAEDWFLEVVQGSLVGIGQFGAVFRLDLRSGQFAHRQLENTAPGGNAVMFIKSITPRCVIGANYSQQNLFKIDPISGHIESSTSKIARVDGEPMCAIGFGGKAYVGIYIQSIISLYDPQKPFQFGQNPRELIELGERYHQTRPRDATTDGKLVFISSDSEYNYLGGVLVVIDPKTNRIDVYDRLILDQNLPSLAYDPSTKLLWGGTDRWGQMHSHPPTRESSLIYAFDPKTRRVVATLTPWPGSDETSVLGVSPKGILVASSGQEIALIDTASHEVLYKGPSPIGVPSKIQVGSDGDVYCLSGGGLYRWDLVQNVLTPVAESPDCIFLAEPIPGTFVLANRTSIFRVKLPVSRTGEQ